MSARSSASSEPTKKKFGKNLNKLTKPPAPPITSNVSRQSSRSGLLVLSTKRSSASGGGGSGLLSSKAVPKPLNTPSLRSETPLTHDSLLSTALRPELTQQHQQPPQAWATNTATNDKQATPEDPLPTPTTPTLAPKGGVSSGYHTPVPAPVDDDRNSTDHVFRRENEDPASGGRSAYGDNSRNYDDRRYGGRADDLRQFRGRGPAFDHRHRDSGDRFDEPNFRRSEQPPRSRYDERERVPDTRAPPQISGDSQDEQVSYMSRLAKERSERRRAEEEARMQEQKERAAQRLKELDEKHYEKHAIEPAEQHGQNSEPLHGTLSGRHDGTGLIHQTDVVLDKLGNAYHGRSENFATQEKPSRSTQRTLFDPNRTYSSLVGGNASREDESAGEKERPSHVRQKEASDAFDSGPVSSPSIEGAKGVSGEGGESTFTVIQLSSYEDRDRGERNISSGPRMLFDPKSGSMVAVPADGGTKRRETKERKKGRGARDRDNKDRDDPTSPRSRAADGQSNVVLMTKGKKSGRGEDSPAARKEKKRGEKDSKGATEGTEQNSNAKSKRAGGRASSGKQQKAREEVRMPRTCGVLYSADESGNFSCVDGCEPDLGYGAHSVPGGRVRNPEAHTVFLQEEQIRMESSKTQGDRLNRGANQATNASILDQKLFSQAFTTQSAQLSRYLTADHFTSSAGSRNHQMTNNNVQDPTYEVAPPILDWVKPNEKIELVCGEDDSPTLQATAHSWVPSEAALAAAAAARMQKGVGSVAVTSDDSDDSDDEDAHDQHVLKGLGFDPTKNMDSVMTSPSMRPDVHASELDAIDFASLTLGPAGQGDATASGGRSLFGPLGSSTWGASPSLTKSGDGNIPSLTGWDSLLREEDSPLRTSTPQDTEPGKLKTGPFLSLSGSDTWGMTGLTGIGGTSFSGSDNGAGEPKLTGQSAQIKG